MADTIQFDLASPERLLKSEPVEMVVVPGSEGDMGILPGHSPLIGTLRPGVIDIHEGGSVKEQLFIAGGFCEVNPETVTVLAEEAVPVASLNKGDAERRLEAAKKAAEGADDQTKAKAEADVRVAEAMVVAAG